MGKAGIGEARTRRRTEPPERGSHQALGRLAQKRHMPKRSSSTCFNYTSECGDSRRPRRCSSGEKFVKRGDDQRDLLMVEHRGERSVSKPIEKESQDNYSRSSTSGGTQIAPHRCNCAQSKVTTPVGRELVLKRGVASYYR